MQYCIIYLSSSKGLLSEEELSRILEHSRQNNQARAITGILMYFNGCIIQVLEGGEESVKTLYKKISQDPRHTQIIPLYSCRIDKRTFPDWSMGYKALSVSNLGHLKEQLPFLDNPTSTPSQQDNVVLKVVERFYLDNRYH